jgi:hypothetical protein
MRQQARQDRKGLEHDVGRHHELVSCRAAPSQVGERRGVMLLLRQGRGHETTGVEEEPHSVLAARRIGGGRAERLDRVVHSVLG